MSWSTVGNGLIFGKHGTVVSAGTFKAHDPGDHSCSLELWLQPRRIDTGQGMILAFYSPENREISFALRQWRNGVVVERGPLSDKNEIYVGELFTKDRPSLVTITSDESGTTAYVDGKIVRKFSNFLISNQNFEGQLVLGNAPRTNFSWSGQIKGLAFYDRMLYAAEVSSRSLDGTQHTETWDLSQHVIARYLFREGKDDIVRNDADPATNLIIPKRFFVVQPWFLQRPWDEYRPTWRYWEDVGINVVGFIPLGFFFCAYLTQVQKMNHPAAVTILLGFTVSLTIEILQAFLPTRESGTTDLITNTFGTALGVMTFTTLSLARPCYRNLS